MSSYSKRFVKFKLLNILAKFQVNKQEFSIQKKKTIEVISLPPTTCQLLKGQNTLAGIWLIKPTEPSDRLNTFFKHYSLQINLNIFSLFIILDLSLEIMLDSPKGGTKHLCNSKDFQKSNLSMLLKCFEICSVKFMLVIEF